MRPILLHSHTRPLTQVLYNKDSDLLFSAAKDNRAVVWSAHNGERLGTFNGHNGAIFAIDIADDSSRFMTGSADNSAKVWDTVTGKSLSELKTSTAVRSVDFSLGDKMILFITDAKMGFSSKIIVHALNMDNSANLGAAVLDITVSGSKPTVAKWIECNKYILTAHADGTVCKWNVATKQKELTAKIHDASINDIQFSAESTFFVSCSEDSTAKLVDLKDFCVKKTYRTEKAINSASISPLREEIIVGGGQPAKDVTTSLARTGHFMVRFFDAIFEEEVGRVKGHFGPVNTLAYRPDGRGFASGGEDGYVRLHEFDADYFDFKYQTTF